MIEEYDIEFFKVGMIFRYLEGAREDVVGTINVITHVNKDSVSTRRWNNKKQSHENGGFTTPIQKFIIQIIKL